MNLQVNDKVSFEGDTYTITTKFISSGKDVSYWLMRENGISSYWVLKTQAEIDEAAAKGTLILLKEKGSTSFNWCQHSYRRYTGAREVYDYCTKCDSKQEVSWRDLK